MVHDLKLPPACIALLLRPGSQARAPLWTAVLCRDLSEYSLHLKLQGNAVDNSRFCIITIIPHPGIQFTLIQTFPHSSMNSLSGMITQGENDYLTVCPLHARVMIAQWEHECISLSILSMAPWVMLAQWETGCISLSVLFMARVMIAQ